MNINTFSYRYAGQGWIEATNGPNVIIFNITPEGLQFNPEFSNRTIDWPELPRVALAAARWHRRN